MSILAIVGDSFACYFAQDAAHSRVTEDNQEIVTVPTWINALDDLGHALHIGGYGGRSWWFSRDRFLRKLQQPDFAEQLDTIVFCHTNPTRINNACNSELSNHNPQQFKEYFTSVHDDEFQFWAMSKWFEEITSRWSHLKTIHFHCFPAMVKYSHLLPGMVFTTPLISISVGELTGTDQAILDYFRTETDRYNHFSLENNRIFGSVVRDAVLNYSPGLHELPWDKFDIVNHNAKRFPETGYGTV